LCQRSSAVNGKFLIELLRIAVRCSRLVIVSACTKAFPALLLVDDRRHVDTAPDGFEDAVQGESRQPETDQREPEGTEGQAL
jgi:hypothetical protein